MKTLLLAIHPLLKLHDEAFDYFILLVEYDRAGTTSLKQYFKRKIDQIRKDRQDMQKRFTEAKALTQLALEENLKIPRKRLVEILSFLKLSGLAEEHSGRFSVGANRLHLGKDAGLIRQHHTNWRIEAIKSLDRGKGAQSDEELHYSAVMSLSNEDALLLREFWVKSLEEFNKIIAPSKDETVRALTIDFFKFI